MATPIDVPEPGVKGAPCTAAPAGGGGGWAGRVRRGWHYRSIMCSGATAFCAYTCNGVASVLALNCVLSLSGCNTVLSVLSLNSVLSIFSVNSALAIGCANSFMKVCW